MRCIKCGGVLEANDVFCMNCGTKKTPTAPPMPFQAAPAPIRPPHMPVPHMSVSPAPMPMQAGPGSQNCATCGQPLATGDMFCMNCGTKTAPVPPPMPIQSAPMPPPPAPTPLPPAPTPLPPAPMPAPPAPAQPLVVPPVAMPTQPAQTNRMNLVFLLDASESSRAHIAGLNSAINNFKSILLGDANTASLLDISMIVFNSGVTEKRPLAPINNMMPIQLTAGGTANFTPPIKEALQYFTGISEPWTYKPWVILISAATPSDDISNAASDIKTLQDANKLRMLALSVGGTNVSYLKGLTDVVLWLDGTDFAPFFTWVAKSMIAISKTAPGSKPALPELENNLYRAK